jgi:hypothetical protein
MNDETDMRPWYRIHRSSLGVIALVIAWFVFINIPGEQPYLLSNDRFEHGWPYCYFDRKGRDHSFWSFAGSTPRFYGEALLLNVLTAFCVTALVACACELWIRRNGRLLRFGTRSLLVATALIAGLVGLVARDVRRCAIQQRALDELAQFGSLDTTRDIRRFDWLRSLVGNHFHGSIHHLRLTATRPVDRLPDLTSLDRLEFLRLEMASIPKNVGVLAAPPSLQHLGFTLTALAETDGSGLTALTELPRLVSLELLGDHVGDNHVLLISTQSRLEALAIASPQITEKSLRQLAKLQRLTHLTLDDAVIQSRDCSVFLGFPSLSSLRFLGNGLTAKDADTLQALWPDAKVDFRGTSAFSSTNPVWETFLGASRD